jgi:uncharacterized repeat protein (TIGR03806 family)
MKKLFPLSVIVLIVFSVISPVNVAGELPTSSPHLQSFPWIMLLLGDSFGLDTRPSNTTCLAPDRETAGAMVIASDPFAQLDLFSQPTKILQAPGENSQWFVLEKGGRIKVFDNAPQVTTSAIWLDISNKVYTMSEGGLLGMAFHPEWPTQKEVFLSYTGDPPAGPMVSYISRFIITDETSLPVSWIEQVILTVDQDFENHDGGDIAFGPDGFLYLGLGDGGSGGDPYGRAQDTTRLLGSFLRIDVLGISLPETAYNIPETNPFSGRAKCGPAANSASCPEIFAWGFRNPWRWSFDRVTGKLWVGDVGQNLWEEVDIVGSGGNYGWDCREGAHDYQPENCSGQALVEPVAEYDHNLGNSITGGFVYRGSAIQDLAGRYVFGDFGSGRIWALNDDGNSGYQRVEILDTAYNISAFGEDQAGELYFVHFGGKILKLEPAGETSPDNVAELLSQTGCVDPNDPTRYAEGLIPYDLNAPFWSDGAAKTRFLGIPNGTAININADNDWSFPSGTVIVKNFALGGKLIETRLLMRHPDGAWAGYTYEWDESQTDAGRLRGGKVRDVNGQLWIYPSEGQCMECHTSAAGFALGPETAQLNKDYTYPSTGRTANQLATLNHIGLLAPPLATAPAGLPRLADPGNISVSLIDRARAYLHTNCSQCHRPAGPTPSSMNLLYSTPFAATNTCDILPEDGDLGIGSARIIAPGDAERSVLTARMNRRDIYAMPPLGSNLVDSAGVLLISAWIDSLAMCP